MSTSHPSPVHQAFDVIHEYVRRVDRENAELRCKVNQKDAAVALITQERDDLKRQVGQLRGQLARKFGEPAIVSPDVQVVA